MLSSPFAESIPAGTVTCVITVDDPQPRLRRTGWPRLPAPVRKVLLELLIHGAMPRAELAERLGISRPTVTRLTRTLIAERLVFEGESELRSSKGRPSELLYVHGGGRHFLGVKLTGDHLYAVLTDLRASVVATADERLVSRRVSDVVMQIAGVARRLAAEGPEITAVGVTLAGTMSRRVDPPVVVESAYLGWHGVSLAADLASATGLPTTVENDVQALTSAEHWFGAGAGLDSMALITVGVGIGCGLIVANELLAGAHDMPGRISHLSVTPTGPTCDKGHQGCAAGYLMSHSIAVAGGSPSDTYEDVLRRAQHGDVHATRVFEDAGYALGAVIGTVCNLVDPQKVLLTGDGLPLYELAAGRVWDGVASTFEGDPAGIDLDVQPFDFSEWARSAAAVAIRATISERGIVAPA